MTDLPTLLAAAEPIENGFVSHVPPSWLQGRTAYGGLSSAMALHAARMASPDLPPLRSAQIAFIGPLAGAVRATATVLRRGRNAAFVQADIAGEAGLGFRATFVFMRALASTVAHDERPPAPLTPPAPNANLYVGPEGFFTGNFEFFDQKATQRPAEWLRWARLRQRDGLDPATELMAIGDGLPPAAFRLFAAPTPLSSLTWQVDLIDPAPATRDGWWLLHAESDFARDGFSTQRMRVWNADGALVAAGMQGVAIFG